MNLAAEHSFDNLKQAINALESEQFTGELNIKSSKDLNFKLYFCLGRGIWADGGCHPHRSWRRLMAKNCSEVEIHREDFNTAEKFNCWNYHLLTILLETDRITLDTFSQIIYAKIEEVLFDLVQISQTDEISIDRRSSSGDYLLTSGLKVSLTLVNIRQAFDKTLKIWQQWSDRDLKLTSPNLAPKVQDKERLAKEVSPQVYENLLELIDGNHTLRDLAVIMKKDVLALTVSLIPYLRNGFFRLGETQDISKSSILATTSKTAKSKPDSETKQSDITIACIDDSTQALGIMKEILNRAGFNFIDIQDPLNVIPKLILSNPDIIFLDIAMPVMNGYEVCAQLRRVPELEKIPIVMLTGQDGVVDRVRAKMAGAADFVGKPIKAAKILNTVMKFVAI